MKTRDKILLVIILFMIAMSIWEHKVSISELQRQVETMHQKNKEQDALIKQLTGTDYELKEKYLFQVEPHRINY